MIEWVTDTLPFIEKTFPHLMPEIIRLRKGDALHIMGLHNLVFGSLSLTSWNVATIQLKCFLNPGAEILYTLDERR